MLKLQIRAVFSFHGSFGIDGFLFWFAFLFVFGFRLGVGAADSVFPFAHVFVDEVALILDVFLAV